MFSVASVEALIMCDEYKSDRYFEKLYSSKLRISRGILRMERHGALTLSAILGNQFNVENSSLASDLEWLFSWKLKACHTPEYYWCDGVEEIVLNQIGKYEFQITATLWIGPEANVNNLNKENVTGNVVLKPTGKGFKNYHFTINYGNDRLVLTKT
ncbi:hypothetical protein TUM4261_18760 [Shewanella sp. c952]|uniref:hypothetical protein n=1 Tax=Shewanella sp. c952 TaxID=2815913 RepID=UPI001BC32582|nr:hypothetical protein [Shewanella sp. c952]GIU09819.1 hypothetical protein TUM4261_18760 [Shewanella sp. c952]